MKVTPRNIGHISKTITYLVLMFSGALHAQTFATLHSFGSTTGNGGINLATNSDGFVPFSLIKSGNTLYGATFYGGSNGCGAVFKINGDGSGFADIHVFSSDTSKYPISGKGEGQQPRIGAILGNTIYGVAQYGGSNASGTVFSVRTDGTGFTNLHNFTVIQTGYGATNSDGANPTGIILSSNALYGITPFGGIAGFGSLFTINTDGAGFSNIFSFTTNGSMPTSLMLVGSNFYGTSLEGGASEDGTIFSLHGDGTGFTNLHVFNFTDGDSPYELLLSGDTLYGSTDEGGASDAGTIFAIHTDGSGFTNLHVFSGTDGTSPDALILRGGRLYGTASVVDNSGTVFSINTDGTGFTNLYNFSSTFGAQETNNDGDNPFALIMSGNIIFGTATDGGHSGTGTVFALTLPAPQLVITPSGSNAVLSWPTNMNGFDFTGYTLQGATDLVSGCWTNVSPGPSIVNGQLTGTNPISSTQMFYRLTQ